MCRCQGCGIGFKVDLIVPDNIWNKIRYQPTNPPEAANLLCGICIMHRIEALNEYDYWELRKPAND